jgi:hypothetical protein
MTTRTTGILHTESVVSAASKVFPENRVASLKGRLQQEDTLSVRAKQRLVFGWGPWGDYRVSDAGSLAKATDGLWIITFGKYGLVAIAALTTFMLLPAAMMVVGLGGPRPSTPAALMLSAVVGLYLVDCLSNAMINPLFGLAAAAAMGSALAVHPRASRANAVDPKRRDVRSYSGLEPLPRLDSRTTEP